VTDAERLRRLYDERVPKGMSQAKFGELYGIGTKAMVWQYLTGYRPLNFESAAKFARGLRCTIADISPEMARRLKAEIFPVLGRVSAKVAIALILAPLLIAPGEVNAKSLHNVNYKSVAAIIHIALVSLFRRLQLLIRIFPTVG
jgi:transcriptional regulator with XRE-family HTH domain